MLFELDEDEPDRPAKEAMLRDLPLGDLAALYRRTRLAAAEARAADAMDRLIRYVRGMKTIQRIAAKRGLILRRRPESTRKD